MRRPTLYHMVAWSIGVLWITWGTTTVAQTRFLDGFEDGLKGWELHGEGGAQIGDSGDPVHKQILVLRPQGNVYALVKGSAGWGGLRIEGEVLFPTDVDSYLGIIYNFRRQGARTDFGLIYIKGNDSYLNVNPHRDFNVGRTLYEEYRRSLKGIAAIQTGKWQRFKAEIIGNACHFYVGDMNTPQLTFSFLELYSGAVGVQPRSVGGDVWVDNVVVTSIPKFSYDGTPQPSTLKYERALLLTEWEVIGPLERTNDIIARHAAAPGRRWRLFETDGRGCVITGQVVDYHGPKTVAYFRTRVQSEDDRPVFLHLSTVDDLALWVNGRFHRFIPRSNLAWYDFWRNPDHKGQQIPILLRPGRNEIVLRVRGGVYASGGFFARIEQ